MNNLAAYLAGAGTTCVFVGPQGSGTILVLAAILALINFGIKQARSWPK